MAVLHSQLIDHVKLNLSQTNVQKFDITTIKSKSHNYKITNMKHAITAFIQL
jgi:hypothetical protein